MLYFIQIYNWMLEATLKSQIKQQLHLCDNKYFTLDKNVFHTGRWNKQ